MAANKSNASGVDKHAPANTVEANDTAVHDEAVASESASATETGSREIGGRDGPDPTRYGDWEKNGRCIDF